MNQNTRVKRIIEIQKIAWAGGITIICEQANAMILKINKQISWLLEKGKQAIKGWGATYMKGQESIWETISEFYDRPLKVF